MTEREIAARECIKLINDYKNFPKTYTTWDDQIATHVKNQLIEAIEQYFEIKK